MLNLKEEELIKYGANITAKEIYQQPELWLEAYNNYQTRAEEVENYLSGIIEAHGHARVIFSGAGTSAFVGKTITPALNKAWHNDALSFEEIGTTDIVANPELYLESDIPTILVSFARSGNSPESIATVNIAKKIVKELYQITITCAPQGKLALGAQGDERNLLLLQPSASNDQGFAMTSSYTCMTLTALLVFDRAELVDKESSVKTLAEYGENVLDQVGELQTIVDQDFSRVVYLGAGGFHGLAQEAQLKILELTAGKIATLYDTPLGFRHGPKSFINEETLVFVFASTDPYVAQYDNDLVNEVYHDQVARGVYVITAGDNADNDAESFRVTTSDNQLSDVYLSLAYIIFGQLFSVLAAIKVGNTPDTPSPTGTVNRVVQGVIIHEY